MTAKERKTLQNRQSRHSHTIYARVRRAGGTCSEACTELVRRHTIEQSGHTQVKRNSCTCGTCRQCKHRVYVAEWRKKRRTSDPFNLNQFAKDAYTYEISRTCYR